MYEVKFFRLVGNSYVLKKSIYVKSYLDAVRIIVPYFAKYGDKAKFSIQGVLSW